jgi:hypothetical protein
MRRYNAADFADPKPRITLYRKRFGVCVYNYRCMDAVSGSRGYGTTPEHAYAAWSRNFKRRAKFYHQRESDAHQTLQRLQLLRVK